MGYSENVWPRALAARGHDVYVVTSTMQVYGDAGMLPSDLRNPTLLK